MIYLKSILFLLTGFLYSIKLNIIFSTAGIFSDAGEGDGGVADDIVNDYSIGKEPGAGKGADEGGTGTGSNTGEGRGGINTGGDEKPIRAEAISDASDSTKIAGVRVGDKIYIGAELDSYLKSLPETAKLELADGTFDKKGLLEKFGVKQETTSNPVLDGLEVVIGGKNIPYTELIKKAEEYYKEVDFSKLDDERKLEYYENYTKIAHREAWDASYTRREQTLSHQRRDFQKEMGDFQEKAKSILNQNLTLKSRLEKIANVTDAEIQEIDDDIKRAEAIANRTNAKRDLEDLNQTIQDNENLSKQMIMQIQREQLREAATIMRVDLENKFTELKPSEDADTINKKLKSTDPGVVNSVSREDRIKLYIIKEIIATALRTGEDPEIIYEVTYKGKFNLTPSGSTGGTGAGTGSNQGGAASQYLPKDFNKLSVKEQIKLLQKLQKDNPGTPGGISSDKTNSSKNESRSGQVMTEEQRSAELSKMGSGY